MLTFFGCATLLAAPPASAERRVALVIGNSAYQHTTPLTNPLNDARDMTAALKATGFEVIEALDADRRRIDGALRSFADKLADADIALFFYAGHGLQLGLENYLVPIDARLERERDLEFEAIKLNFILRQMEIDREGKTTIVMLDACRDNPLARNLARSMGTRSVAVGRGLAAAATGLGTFIAYATQPGNVALDGDGRNSPFTSALTKHMRTQGRNLNATMIAVRNEVVAATGGRQVPWDHSALTGDFYFVPRAVTPQQGTVASAPQGSSTDLAALQRRLRTLEDEVKARDAEIGSGRLRDLQAKAADLEELTRDQTRKLFDLMREQGQAADAAAKAKVSRELMNLRMEMARRNQDLARVRGEIAAIRQPPASGVKPAEVAAAPIERATSVPPVTPAPDPNASAASFTQVDNVRIDGNEIRSFRAPSPAACRNACAQETGCVAYQHGRKIPVMGTCALFSKVDARNEDRRWRSGVRKTELKDEPVGLPERRKGFLIYDSTTVSGTVIKSSNADSVDSCLVVCRNTSGCVAANFSQLSTKSKPMCIAFKSVQATRPHLLTGTSVLLLKEP
ncbi:MAG: caspase family protein [Hyphomicrobiaceae bacterium]|nr:caspase family protein [Hyphomicrobiaceae bacterium]